MANVTDAMREDIRAMRFDAEKQMSNSDLQEAITMANAMTKNTGQDSPTYPAIRAHLETLLLIQQARARHGCIAGPNDKIIGARRASDGAPS